MCLEQFAARAIEWLAPGNHPVERAPQRINVGAAVDGCIAARLLGRQKGRRAIDLARHRLLDVQVDGRTKVEQKGAATLVQQNIARLDVTMHDAFVMSELQRITQLPDDGQRFL